MTEHYLTVLCLANEIARIAGADGWHRADWRHPIDDLRMDLDDYSAQYIAPALRNAKPVKANPVPSLMHRPRFRETVARNGVSVDVVGEYDIETDEMVFAAFYKRTEAVAA